MTPEDKIIAELERRAVREVKTSFARLRAAITALSIFVCFEDDTAHQDFFAELGDVEERLTALLKVKTNARQRIVWPRYSDPKKDKEANRETNSQSMPQQKHKKGEQLCL
jgi:hypothetical protein